MKLSAEDPEAAGFVVVDAETGEPIDDVVWADDEAGKYIQLRKLPDGKYDVGPLGFIRSDTKPGNIRFERIDGAAA